MKRSPGHAIYTPAKPSFIGDSAIKHTDESLACLDAVVGRRTGVQKSHSGFRIQKHWEQVEISARCPDYQPDLDC